MWVHAACTHYTYIVAMRHCILFKDCDDLVNEVDFCENDGDCITGQPGCKEKSR